MVAFATEADVMEIEISSGKRTLKKNVLEITLSLTSGRGF